MANLKVIRKRIASVKSTQKITRAMKLVAAARLRKAQQNIVELRPYAKSRRSRSSATWRRASATKRGFIRSSSVASRRT
jgi:ATP synthase F1 gamma subunit